MVTNIVLLAALVASDPPPRSAGIHFIDVGQGSAALLITRSGDAVLVDSGPAAGAEAVLAALGLWEVETLSLWVHTHFDADHIGAFAPVIRGLDGRLGSEDDIEVEQLWDRGFEAPLPDSEAFALYASMSAERGRAAAWGRRFVAPGLVVEAIQLDAPLAEAGENDLGLALCVELDGLRALLPGDLSAARLQLAAAHCAPIDVLWASHHGARDGISAAVLEATTPWLTVISAGHDNGYCHPAALSLARLHDHQVAILDAAGLLPGGRCDPIYSALGPAHRVLGGSLWVASSGETWIGDPGGWLEAGLAPR